MAVPRPNIRWRGAHPNNFTVGRPGASRDGRETFHHVVGSRESAVVVFNQPTRGASSHFVVGGDIIDQCVDINNTAWCDANWESNLRTIAVEHEGGWNGTGPYSDAMYEQAAHLCAWLRENYGVNRALRHRDVSLKSTACPGGLDVERIWNRSTEIIKYYSAPVDNRPQWLKDRQPFDKVLYSQIKGLRLYNLNDPSKFADARVFPLNQNFDIGSFTTINGIRYYITKSSTGLNAAIGIKASELAEAPYVPPVPQPVPQPPQPATPGWVDSLIKNDKPNVTMYVLRATPLIDLENGRPVVKDGKEIWYQAGDIIENISTHTIISEITYQVTEYSLQETKKGRYQNANGIKSSDLTLDPKATPPGTPANPNIPSNPADPPGPMPDVPTPIDDMTWLRKAIQAILDFLGIKLKT